MIVIGIVGKQGSGKDSFVRFCRMLLSHSRQQIENAAFSDIIRTELKHRGLAPTRHNLQEIGQKIPKKVWGDGMKKRIHESQADIFMVTGIRTWNDVSVIRSFPQHVLIAISAPQRIRYERLRNRGEKADEHHLSWTDFLNRERHPIEHTIEAIMKNADIHFPNHGTPDQFRALIQKNMAKVLKYCSCDTP